MEKRLQEQETENQMLQSRLEEAQKQFVNSAADLKAQVEAASKLEDEAKRWQTLAETHANSLLDLEKAREKLIHQERSLESLRSERELDSKKYQDKADVVQRNLHQMTLQAEDLQRKLNEANERIEVRESYVSTFDKYMKRKLFISSILGTECYPRESQDEGRWGSTNSGKDILVLLFWVSFAKDHAWPEAEGCPDYRLDVDGKMCD